MQEEGFYYLNLEHIESLCRELAIKMFKSKNYSRLDFTYLNKNMMEYAIHSPTLHYYESLYSKAGNLGFHIIKGHALKDGNKRIGMTATLVFLIINGYILQVAQKDIIDTAIKVADNKISKNDFIIWVEQHSKPHKDKNLIQTLLGFMGFKK